MSNLSISSSIFITLIFISVSITESTVPPSKTFTVINTGDLDNFASEYGGDYRYSTLHIRAFPFSLCFYNSSDDAFILGLMMGSEDNESILRFVWNANRLHPVRQNATLTFGRDGNLVLRDIDGSIAWQTNTANKGVVGLNLLPNGNLVLYDARNRFIWQSFDHPSDTLFVGQSLRPNGPNKIVAHRSNRDQSDGLYSMVLESNRLALYLQSKNSQKLLLYYSEELSGFPLSQVLFNSARTNQRDTYELLYESYVNNSHVKYSDVLAKIKYDSTLSVLRLDYDGNLRIYTYYDKIDTHAWEVTYSLFGGRFGACGLPSKCGSLGICDSDQCIACPTPKGLLGWTDDCQPPKLPPCNVSGGNIDYYKVVDVEHFLSLGVNGQGNTTMEECREMCTKDCGCLGFFYWEDLHRCFLAPELLTLRKAYNTAHVGYIKKAKK